MQNNILLHGAKLRYFNQLTTKEPPKEKIPGSSFMIFETDFIGKEKQWYRIEESATCSAKAAGQIPHRVLHSPL